MGKLSKDIDFFDEYDRQHFGIVKGKMKSTFPKWYFTNKIKDLEMDIRSLNERIKNFSRISGVESSYRDGMEQELHKKTELYNILIAGRPQLQDKDRDRLWEFYKWSSKVLHDLMIPRSEMKAMYRISAQEVYDRDHNLDINIQAWRDIIKACEQLDKCDKNMASLKIVTICWKIVGSLLGEPTNAEKLRKDILTGERVQERPLLDLEREQGLRQ
jgi:hypothetical protein